MFAKFDLLMDWLAQTYVDALNCVHYMHDKYAYERIEMALHDSQILRTMACGIAGLSVVADSLSAITYATVTADPGRERPGGRLPDIEGDFPTFGNDDDRVDEIAADIVRRFMAKVRQQQTYRDAKPTQSVLTITSNVVYGKATGNTPDGRRQGEPFAPGANPMNGRDRHGMLASALSVAKLPYDQAQDGISLTATVVPSGLGRDKDEQVGNLVGLLDAYMISDGLPHEHQRAQPGHPAGRDGPPGELPAADDPGLGLRGELRPADPRAAAGRAVADLPRRRVSRLEDDSGRKMMIIDLGLPTTTAPPAERSERLAAVRDGTLGSVHSWELVTAVDGPGTRLTIFLAGCALRCQYCHNPDTWNINHGSDTSARRRARADRPLRDDHVRDRRRGDGLRRRAAAAAGLRGAGSSGTAPNGESTPPWTPPGFLGSRASDELLADTSLVLLDVKSGLPDVYRKTTGRELQPTLDFGRRLAEHGQADVDPVRAGARPDR